MSVGFLVVCYRPRILLGATRPPPASGHTAAPHLLQHLATPLLSRVHQLGAQSGPKEVLGTAGSSWDDAATWEMTQLQHSQPGHRLSSYPLGVRRLGCSSSFKQQKVGLVLRCTNKNAGPSHHGVAGHKDDHSYRHGSIQSRITNIDTNCSPCAGAGAPHLIASRHWAI